MQFPVLKLKKNEDRRIKAGHLWVFSNEINTKETPFEVFDAGQLVNVCSHNGKSLGIAYINPASLICARMMSRDPKHPPSQSLLVHRIKVALSLRERLFDKPYYRLVFGESDFLPGLVVDRYGDVLVVQLTTAGMEVMKQEVVMALEKVLKPKNILLRNDSSAREREGLPLYQETALGDEIDSVYLEDMGVKYQAPIKTGQKTGWYYDQRMNRQALTGLVKGQRVLDVFSYIGAWGVKAAVEGATEVVCIDASAQALEHVGNNAELNSVADRMSGIKGDAFEAMKGLREEREKFDVVIVDPPAFIKRKKDFKAGREAYRRLNQMAIQLLSKDGILVSGSCSHHLPRKELQGLMLQSARHLDRNMQILIQGYQGPDHPVHPAIPETEYLKAIFARVIPA
ncbi:MAG: class I SAM-dependent rRNA methyltransferase [Gammaproteobacteria bacterium]|nr:class I SAM-dependent rRNA methyltransferase [Gammaproteobacteria bacterium]MCW8909911.1 class I SAM-dependent rRNA methyltransferase [Gammaproteobacteria bacterium]MCW9003884.1 class I SAM-dependent rRNA methyltransferase [Gammaproteobacteria bacterium]MCW9055173.1 class I SAM-dependent rRNA methyltransferase [Gammaproteobacteria bacterium]